MTYEFEGKTEKEAIEIAANELGLERNQFDVEILEVQKKSIFSKGYVKIKVHTLEEGNNFGKKNIEENYSRIVVDPLPQDEFEQKMIEFITEIVTKMGYTAKVSVSYREGKKLGIKMDSPNSSILIGRKGKNLDALQLLSNIYAGRLGHEEVRIILDTENYRIRREEALVRLAYNTADKVRSSKRSILLEPMNPFERRLIHTTLNDIPDVETKSEGEGVFKQVRVIYKGIR